MILGFAHITRNVPKLQGGWLVVNAPEKWPLMERRAVWHSLLLKLGVLTEEMVEYDTGVVDQHLNRLDVEDGRVLLGARDPWREGRFFYEGLGFEYLRGVGVTLRLDGRLADWQVDLDIWHDACAPLDQPLDVAGYTALAFYSSDVEADRHAAIAAGGHDPTSIFTVSLDRKMRIAMLRSPEGTIIELIEVMR